MNKEKDLLTQFPLAGTKNGTISISHIEEPYGEKSNPIVSIGISLKGDLENPDWKAHIPYENVSQVVKALQDAQEKYSS